MPSAEPGQFQPTPVFRARRRRTLVRVQLRDTAGQALDVMVQDISANGLNAVARDCALSKDEVISLHLPDGKAFWGVVRWREGNRFGVEFDTAIDGLSAAEGHVPTQSICFSPTRR